MRIRTFPEKCIGVGQCVVAAPDIFAQNDDDGIVYMLHDDITPERREAVIAAARLCPTLAIVLEAD